MNSSLSPAIRNLLVLGSFATTVTLTALAGSEAGYREIDLVSDLPGAARFADTNLLNPWGFLNLPGGELVVVDNHANAATLYQGSGKPLPFHINVAAATDVAMNQSERAFIISEGNRHDESILLFASEDGTISGWNPRVDKENAVAAVDNSASGAIYKSMVLARAGSGLHLYAANFGQGAIEIYDHKFQLVKSFTDNDLATNGFVPFGIRLIQGRLFVTFAFKASSTDDDETAGPGLGYVDEFDLHGNLVRRFASEGTLNAPWGLALAPKHFGQFGGALLVGNFGDGAISAYNPHTGAFLGQLADAQGNILRISGLWGLSFGHESEESALYFTAGPNDENDGLLGAIVAPKSRH